MKTWFFVFVGLLLAAASSVSASGLEDADRCLVKKIEASGRYCQCLLKSDARAIRTSDQPAEYDKCVRQFELSMRIADAGGKGQCVNPGDYSTVGPYIQDSMYDVMTLLTQGSFETCGDGTVNGYELCDNMDLQGLTCQDFGFVGGVLTCSSGCTFNFAGCSPTTCGNGSVNAGEQCDGGNLGGATCVSLGYSGGTLSCTSLCGYDVAQCALTTCGNGAVDGYEQCDGTNLGGNTCSSLGFAGGALSCNPGCSFNLSGCVPQQCSTCGDGVVQVGEDCDLGDLGGDTCGTLGYGGGILRCGPGCIHDTSSCFNSRFEDLGTTILDNQTGLEWEKLTDDGSIHDYDNAYTWSDASSVKVAALNTSGFASASDWRLPSSVELFTLVDHAVPNPAILALFNSGCASGCTACSCSKSLGYWTPESYLADGTRAWYVTFSAGTANVGLKSGSFHVRAVRTAN